VRTGEIWIGTDDGLIQLTQDEGKTWTNVTPPQLTPWSKVTNIEASHSDPGTAYVAVDRHRLDDLRPYLYRTRDFGKTWQLTSRGIPDGSFLNCVREDPVRKSLLYACTEKSVAVSFNDGDDCQTLQLNLPTTSVRDLVVHGDDLVIATHGRAFWVLDNVTVLRQMSAEVASVDTWLFKPAVAYSVQSGSDQGTPVPMDESMAKNAPFGAALDYYLKSKPNGPIQLEIADSSGKLVWRFASDDEPKKIDAISMPISAGLIHADLPLSGEAGMHRFVWDLHYSLPRSVRPTFYGPSGPSAVPGSYMVKLTVNGKSISKPLTIKMDPRVKTQQPALVRQFQAASRLAAQLGDVSSALKQAEDLRKQISERQKEAAKNPEPAKALTEAHRKISEFLEADGAQEFGFFGSALPGQEPVSLAKLTSAISRLLMLVESADAAPSADANLAIEKWDAAAKETLVRWNSTRTEEQAVINPLLKKAGLQPLSE
jgi:hypothetical protein